MAIATRRRPAPRAIVLALRSRAAVWFRLVHRLGRVGWCAHLDSSLLQASSEVGLIGFHLLHLVQITVLEKLGQLQIARAVARSMTYTARLGRTQSSASLSTTD